MAKLAVIVLCLTQFAFPQAKLGGSGKLGGASLMSASASVNPSGSAVAIADPPQLSTCGTTYQSTTGTTTVTYTLGLYDSGSSTHCTDAVPAVLDTAATNALTGITRRDTSGAACSTSGCSILFDGMGMSVMLTEFSQFTTSVTNAAILKANTLLLNHALSSNDLPEWFPWTTGVQPTACTVVGNSCAANGLGNPPANQGDRICTNLTNQSRDCKQVQVTIVDQSNGRVHQYQNGCIASGSGSSTVYKPCSPLDGTHTVNDVTQVNNIDATNTLSGLGEMMRGAKSRMPNLAIAFFSSRAYGGYCTTGCADPEPYAYEKALAIRALIDAQACELGRTGCALGTIDPVAGDLCPDTTAVPAGCGGSTVSGSAPVLLWADCQASGTGACKDSVMHSGYSWANGATARNDALVWCDAQSGAPCSGAQDFLSPDFLHLSTAGNTKVAVGMPSPGTEGWLGFFRHSPYTTPWFCQTNGSTGC
jgi:hypothetical protein